MNTIGSRIKHLRSLEKLTQKDFSRRLLVSQSYLSGLENNNEFPTNKLIKLICLEFGINENWLTDNIGEIYDDVYENDRSASSEISNSALLNILMLLSTKSNVEYGMYAHSLSCFSGILSSASLSDENFRIEYLNLMEVLLSNLAYAIRVFCGKHDKEIHDNHKKVVLNDLEQLFSFLLESNHNI